MHLVLVGISHHEAPIELRERLNCAPHTLHDALAHLSACPGVTEGVILSTCNRMEVYAAVHGSSVEEAYRALTHHLARFHQIPEAAFAARLYCKSEAEAGAHLLRVAGGLDSLVLGEPQILGQVKAALKSAQTAQSSGPLVSKLFTFALEVGKRIRTETGIGKGGFSIGHAAVGLAQRILDDFSRARVLILGAGKMSEVTAAHLKRSGVQFVVVANRTYDKAVTLAQRLGGQAIQYDQFLDEMVRADIVIASTAAPHPILRREMLAPVMKKRRGKPLFLIDIALPRDIDPDVNGLENVYLRNIDDLQEYMAQDTRARSSEVAAAEQIITAEIAAFMSWLRQREAVPVIARLRSHLEDMTQERLNILRSRLGDINPRDWQIIETQMRALMDQVALEPTRRLKRAMQEANAETGASPQYDLLEATTELFGLEERKGEKEKRRKGEEEGEEAELPTPNTQHPTPDSSFILHPSSFATAEALP